ncbi:MAG: DNRLRE domain-containing protein [Chitinophagaceae bacterium]
MAEAWTCDYIGHPTCNYRALFKFDLTDIPESSIVDSVKLFLYAQTNNVEGLPGSPTYGDDNASLLRKILEPWDLLNTGWDNQPLVSYPDQKVLEQSTSPVQNYVIDITDFANDWIAHPENNNGMLMKLANEAFYNSMIFNSGKAADDLKPTLKIYLKKGALPVLLKNFSGNLVNGNVNLYWSVLDGTTLANIIVERSYDSRSFNGFVTIPAKDVTTEINYTTTDFKVAAPDGKVFYRLKLVNKDGTYKYSSVLLIHLSQNSTDVLLMPNPVKENFQLIFNAKNNSRSDFRILNSLGQAVDKFTYQIEVGNNSISVIPSKNLAPGLYIVQFTLDGHIITKRFLKQ